MDIHYLGGVEVCAGFSSEQDRELVLAAAEKAGWEPPTLGSPGEEPGDGVGMWEVRLGVASLVVESKCVESAYGKDHMHCFLRYRFFDLGESPYHATPTSPSPLPPSLQSPLPPLLGQQSSLPTSRPTMPSSIRPASPFLPHCSWTGELSGPGPL